MRWNSASLALARLDGFGSLVAGAAHGEHGAGLGAGGGFHGHHGAGGDAGLLFDGGFDIFGVNVDAGAR